MDMVVEGMTGSHTSRLSRGAERGEGESGARGRRVWMTRGESQVVGTGRGAPAKAAIERVDDDDIVDGQSKAKTSGVGGEEACRRSSKATCEDGRGK